MISQVYGAGGNKGASLTNDFVELFNNGTTSVTMTGWALQYASSGGTWSTDNPPTPLKTATIEPGEYYLVQLAAGNTPSGALPTPDDTGSLALSGTSGTVVLTTDTTPLSCETSTCTAVASVVDVVGYGAATVVSGAGPTGPTNGLAATQGVIRKGDGTDDGCTNSGNNSADFDTLTETTTTPRNSATTKHTCAASTGGTGKGAGLLISQVYGGGGNSGATYDTDFVELFNPTAATISTANLSIQYGSGTGDIADPYDGAVSTNLVALPTASIPPGGYFLVAMGTPATPPVGAPLAFDFTGTAALGASAGKVALVNNTTALACGSTTTPCTGTPWLDLVAYGGAGKASPYEGTGPAPALSATLSAQRGDNGCTNAKDDSTDFTAALPAPRNSKTAVNLCSAGMSDAGTDAGPADAGADSGPVDSGTKDSGTGPTDGGTGDTDSGGTSSGSTLVISQVFGDGAYGAMQPDADYVEIFNRSSSAQSLQGLSLQYGSASSDFAVPYDGGDTSLIPLPDVMIPAGGYFLVGLASGDAGTPLPKADWTGQVNISYDNGKIALVNGTTALSTCGAAGSLCPTSDFADLVGYGTASQYEGAPTTAVGSGAGFRNDEGCTDTDNNLADFTAGTPAPRNSASPLHLCTGGGGTADSGTGGGTADSGTGGGGGGTADSGSGSADSGSGGGGGGTADSGSGASGDDDDDDDDSTGGKGVTMIVSDPNSGGCSTSGSSSNSEGALSFGAFAVVALAFANRRKKNRG